MSLGLRRGSKCGRRICQFPARHCAVARHKSLTIGIQGLDGMPVRGINEFVHFPFFGLVDDLGFDHVLAQRETNVAMGLWAEHAGLMVIKVAIPLGQLFGFGVRIVHEFALRLLLCVYTVFANAQKSDSRRRTARLVVVGGSWTGGGTSGR